MNCIQILRRPLKIVQADDPLRLSIPGYQACDVFFQVNVLDPTHDRRPQEHLPRFFTPRPFASVHLTPAGNHDWPRPIREQAPQVHFAVDVIQPQLYELRALLDQVTMLGNDVPVPTSPDAYADHCLAANSGNDATVMEANPNKYTLLGPSLSLWDQGPAPPHPVASWR
jgi:hypothetical protein